MNKKPTTGRDVTSPDRLESKKVSLQEKIVTVNIEQDEETNTMGQVYKILNLVLKFDLRDNPNGGTYSLLEVAYLKLRQDDGIPLTDDDNIAARRLSRVFPIMCVMSFLESCSLCYACFKR